MDFQGVKLICRAGSHYFVELRRYLAGLLNFRGIDKRRYMHINTSKEDKSMLVQSIQRIEEKGIKKGRAEGKAEGSHAAKLETAKKNAA